MNFSIDHQCPQCGAPAVLEEAERLFNCPFCRVRSYLLGGPYFRYMFEPKSIIMNREIIYVPYWRYKGMMFTGSLEGMDHRFVDISSLAIQSDHFPESVGLRSQALKLKFVVPGTRGSFLKPTLPIHGMLNQFESCFRENSKKQISYSAFVGDHLSLIYSPFYLDQKIYDAILEKPITSGLPEKALVSAENTEKPNWPIRFIPVICPDCGWDLDGGRDSLTLNCLNCQISWMSTGKGLLKLKFGIMSGELENSFYLPFWRIKASVAGIQLNSYKDLIQRANLPKAIQKGMEDKPFYFWVQAFKVRPKIFIQLSRQLTLAQPDQGMTCEFPRSGMMYPVTLSVTEAVKSLKINLADFIRPAREILNQLSEIEIQPERFKLVYIPFYEDHHELIQPDFHLAVHKNMLSMAKNL
jgi:hypothetical protein